MFWQSLNRVSVIWLEKNPFSFTICRLRNSSLSQKKKADECLHDQLLATQFCSYSVVPSIWAWIASYMFPFEMVISLVRACALHSQYFHKHLCTDSKWGSGATQWGKQQNGQQISESGDLEDAASQKIQPVWFLKYHNVRFKAHFIRLIKCVYNGHRRCGGCSLLKSLSYSFVAAPQKLQPVWLLTIKM